MIGNLRGLMFVVCRFTEAHSLGKGGEGPPILHANALELTIAYKKGGILALQRTAQSRSHFQSTVEFPTLSLLSVSRFHIL
jgi:hypothetical protein